MAYAQPRRSSGHRVLAVAVGRAPGNAKWDLLGYRVVSGTRSAPEPTGPKSCSSWPSAEAFGHVSVGHVGWGPGAPSVCTSSLSSALTEAGGQRLQPPSLLEAGRPLDGAAGVSRGSGKVDQNLSRITPPSTLHAACPGAWLPGWKDRRLKSIVLPWMVGLPAETY